MYTTKKWRKSAQNRRFKAFLFTAAFHLVLFAGIVYTIDSDIQDLIPDFLKELILEAEPENTKTKKPTA